MTTSLPFPMVRISIIMAAALAFACGITTSLRAQTDIDSSTAGTTYVFAFPDTASNRYDPRQDTDPTFTKRDPLSDSVFVTIYSPVANAVTITGDKGYGITFSMNAGEFRTVWLNGTPRAASPICDDIGIVSNKTFRMEATSPVIAYCFMATKFGTEAFTPQPVAAWGTEYYAAARSGEVIYDETPTSDTTYGKTSKAAPAEVLIVAAYDNTRVTIVPNARLDKNPATSVTLMKDQCYQVRSYVDTSAFNAGNPQPDIGGSYIYATKPIGVISGNTRAQVLDQSGGLVKNAFKNMMIEWMSPTEQHGTQFVYLPTWDSRHITGAAGEDPDKKRQGEVVRVFGTTGSPIDVPPTITKGTDIDGRNGNVLQAYDIPRMGFYEALIGAPAPHLFVTDRPAQAYMTTTAVVAFDSITGSGSHTGASYETAATYMVGLTPREQWTSVAPYIAPTHPEGMSHYLNIATDSSSRSRITINGTPLVIDRRIVGTDLYWTSITLSSGERGIIRGADSTCRFYAFVYGGKTGGEAFTPSNVHAPAAYQENIGFMYGYPLAPAHRVLHPSGSSSVGTSENIAGYAFDAVEPNPFSTSARIGFTLGAGGHTSIELYDRAGKRIATLADANLDAGKHALDWDATGIPSGIYYCRIQSGRWSVARPLFLVR